MTADASLTLIFLSGFAGGLTLEIAKAYSVFPTQSFPARFKDWRYWIMTVLVAVAGWGFCSGVRHDFASSRVRDWLIVSPNTADIREE